MSARSDSRVHQVRQLLQRLAAPHPGLRLLTADLEARVAALTPSLHVLEAAPFDGLTSSVPAAESPRSAAGAARRRRSNQSGPGDRLATSAAGSLGSGAAASPPSSRTLDPAASGSAPNAHRAAPGSNPPNPTVRAAASAKALDQPPSKAPPREFVFSLGKRRSIDSPSGPTEPAQPPEQGKVDVGALAQRVMQKQLKRSNLAAAAAGSSVADRPEATRPDPKGSHPAARGIGLPLSPHRPDRPLLWTPETNRLAASRAVAPDAVAGESPRTTPKPAVGSRVTHEASRVAPSASLDAAFVFDPFEERAAAEDNDFTLTQRIDQILREQARRQGVDLT